MEIESTQELGPTLGYIANRLSAIAGRVEEIADRVAAIDAGIDKRIDKAVEEAKDDIARELEHNYISITELDEAIDGLEFISSKDVEAVVEEMLDKSLEEDSTVENITHAAIQGAMKAAGERNLWATDEQMNRLEARIATQERGVINRGLWGRLQWLLTGK